ncbi:unnamed protein product [Euphydryas editha]|uniref:Uncharacterized protein n=1 Tax=Euphydryas editha TaxID=104508 RepID=A0AAU9UFR2_EUPED|nr:unnamed protein product [Euphydryas editha]
METCVKGFSFMPETNVHVMDLKYVESDALERTWKITRRERLKQQEQKIWEEFVKEEDILRNISQDDPYQFINQLPEACIKELLDLELQKMKQEIIEEDEADKPQDEEVPQPVADNQHVVTFVEENECDMLHLFDDDKDDDVSGPEEELLNDSIGSPCTVREKHVEDAQTPASKSHSPDKISNKSSAENVTDLIESSIYSAKVKELIMKINDELVNIIEFLERQDFRVVDPTEVPKMMKLSTEFSARFSRVRAYPLQRQLVEVERHSRAPPLGRRVHAQALAARLCSLLNNLRAAAQIFLKSVTQCVCMSASDTLQTLIQLTTDAVDISSNVIKDLQTDDIKATCDKLSNVLVEYMKSITDYMKNIEDMSATNSKKQNKTKGPNRKKSIGARSKFESKSNATDTRLAMYSTDSRGHSLSTHSGTSKMHINVTRESNVNDKEEISTTNQKKTPRNRPLMRAPAAAHRRRPLREQDVHTLVESVPCTSNHISRDASPISTPKSTRTPRHKERTPKTIQNTKKINYTPKNIHNSPKTTTSPRNVQKTLKVNSPKPIVDLELSTNVDKRDKKEAIENKKETDLKCNVNEREETMNGNARFENRRDEDVQVGEMLEKERNKVREK